MSLGNWMFSLSWFSSWQDMTSTNGIPPKLLSPIVILSPLLYFHFPEWVAGVDFQILRGQIETQGEYYITDCWMKVEVGYNLHQSILLDGNWYFKILHCQSQRVLYINLKLCLRCCQTLGKIDMVANTMKKPEESPTSIKINWKILFGPCQDSTGKWEYWFQEGLVPYGAVRTDETDRNLKWQACALYIYKYHQCFYLPTTKTSVVD